MKVTLCFVILATANAFAPQASFSRDSTSLQAESRREAFAAIAGAAFSLIPAASNAAEGESPRFSVFGLIGDGTSMSEGAAYGTDQKGKLYSPYSVYGERSEASLYESENAKELKRKKDILAESKIRLGKLPAYIERKEWSNVKTELTRYMYETRGAVRSLAKTTTQKEKADAFFRAIEETYGAATLKKQEQCAKFAAASVTTLDAFVATI